MYKTLYFNMAIEVGEKRGIIKSEGDSKLYFIVTEANVENIRLYEQKQDKEWLFTDVLTDDVIAKEQYKEAEVGFTSPNGVLQMNVSPMRNGGGRRSRKVKKSKSFKKRPTRRGRSSKARKARATRRN
jgi:hypothetical protein